jgi:hypothetical protein
MLKRQATEVRTLTWNIEENTIKKETKRQTLHGSGRTDAPGRRFDSSTLKKRDEKNKGCGKWIFLSTEAG